MIEVELAKQLDKFYTNQEVAKQIIETTVRVLSLQEEIQEWVEPSAGSGSFSLHLANKCIAYDILPEHPSIEKKDFLSISEIDKNKVAIGNPPFGRRNSLSIDFLNHAGKLYKAVSFIVPVSFMKWGIQKNISSSLSLVYSEEIAENSFTFLKEDFSIRTCHQIWVDREVYPDLEDIRLKSSPPISLPEEFEIWQYNGTKEAKRYLYEDWKYATYRQGYKDYSRKMTRDDYKEVKEIVENTTIQLFFFKPKTKEAEDIFLSMDLNRLSLRNMTTPGFGKADFVQFYLETKSEKI